MILETAKVSTFSSIGSRPSTTMATIWASLAAREACSITHSEKKSSFSFFCKKKNGQFFVDRRHLCSRTWNIPPVSTTSIVSPIHSKLPYKRSRVVPATLLTRALFLPQMRLNRLLLPTLGLEAKDIKESNKPRNTQKTKKKTFQQSQAKDDFAILWEQWCLLHFQDAKKLKKSKTSAYTFCKKKIFFDLEYVIELFP